MVAQVVYVFKAKADRLMGVVYVSFNYMRAV